jgi:hypothetical protein
LVGAKLTKNKSLRPNGVKDWKGASQMEGVSPTQHQETKPLRKRFEINTNSTPHRRKWNGETTGFLLLSFSHRELQLPQKFD